MSGGSTFMVLESLPDREHFFCSGDHDLVIKHGERVNALHRMTDGGIDEHQDTIEHVARHAQDFAGYDNRLTQFIARDTMCLVARNRQRAGELMREVVALAGEDRRFEVLADGRIVRHAACVRRERERQRRD